MRRIWFASGAIAGVAVAAIWLVGAERQLQTQTRLIEALAERVDRLVAKPPAPRATEGAPLEVNASSANAIALRVAQLLPRAPAAAPMAGSDAPPAAPEPTPAQRQSIQQANEIVDQSLRAGRLSARDASQIRRLAAEARDPEAVQSVFRRIIVALNRDELQVESLGALLR